MKVKTSYGYINTSKKTDFDMDLFMMLVDMEDGFKTYPNFSAWLRKQQIKVFTRVINDLIDDGIWKRYNFAKSYVEGELFKYFKKYVLDNKKTASAKADVQSFPQFSSKSTDAIIAQ